MDGNVTEVMSHPTWVRGLKHRHSNCKQDESRSHPTWVRGLKLIEVAILSLQRMSHPTWVRGLKRLIFLESKTFYTLTI